MIKTKTKAKITATAQDHIDSLTARINGFQDAITEISDRWKSLVSSLVGNLQTPQQRSALRQIQFLSSELRTQLNGLGYTHIAQNIVSGYSDSVAYAANMADFAVIGPQQPLSPLMSDALLHVRELDLSAFEYIGNNAIRQLAKELTMDVMVGVPRTTMLSSINAILDNEFAGKANLYVDTATRQYDRQVTMSVWKEAGLTQFTYFGPADNKTSEFCAEHVGKSYSLAEIQKMNNGMPAPYNNVLVYGGHPRCRHTFQPHQDATNNYPEPKTKSKKQTESKQQSLF